MIPSDAERKCSTVEPVIRLAHEPVQAVNGREAKPDPGGDARCARSGEPGEGCQRQKHQGPQVEEVGGLRSGGHADS